MASASAIAGFDDAKNYRFYIVKTQLYLRKRSWRHAPI
jgi:hypothetical protein